MRFALAACFTAISISVIADLGAVIPSESLQSSRPLESLDQLRWKHRIILVRHSGNCDAEVSRLNAAKAEVVERDILWFAFCADNLTTNYLGTLGNRFKASIHMRYFNEDKTGALLIGKDGGIKNRAPSLNLTSLNQQIDAMPMRQQEIHQREMRQQNTRKNPGSRNI